jgi:hypothetical protein
MCPAAPRSVLARASRRKAWQQRHVKELVRRWMIATEQPTRRFKRPAERQSARSCQVAVNDILASA